ncbi:MAG: OmpA family protein [Chlamydiia bacterium]|nr:OmpA family protein [Chlamydiia bacterium]
MRRWVKLSLLFITAITLSSCHRSRQQFWEDTKTCSRYMGKGMRSFLGSHADPYDLAYGHPGTRKSDFVVLRDDECYEEAMFVDCESKTSDFDMMTISQKSPGDPGSPLPGIEGFSEPLGRLAQIFIPLHFATDKYEVVGMENLKTIEQIADYLHDHPNTYLFIEGHADERGAAAYNLALGSRRSNSVRSYLMENGIAPDRIFTISYGKERPLNLSHDELAWSQNRRAQFKIYER